MKVQRHIEVDRSNGSLRIDMPAASNRWIIGLGLGVGIPWLLSAIGSFGAGALVEPSLRREVFLGVVILNLLLFIAHILAVCGIWLALYEIRGRESLFVTSERVSVERVAVGITIPVRIRRTLSATVRLLDITKMPGRTPHPRLEVTSGASALRFGAGLDEADARRVHSLVAEEFELLLEQEGSNDSR